MALLWLLTLFAPVAQGLNFKTQELRSGHQDGLAPMRANRRAGVLSTEALKYFSALENASSKSPVLLMGLREGITTFGEFEPSKEFQSAGEFELEWQGQGQGQNSELPWGVGSPSHNGGNAQLGQVSAMPVVDFAKDLEYSLEAGGNMQSFSSAQQDVKLITQVLENVTNGFFLDTNGGDGEMESNTLLLELTGWRGLIMEPDVYLYATLWAKMRKAWLFLGCMSPHENATKIGFDIDGNIDMLSGHQIHAYSLVTFLAEMGGRRTVDFWNLKNGHYEAEVLEETLLRSGKDIEIGVVLVNFDGRSTGRGSESFVSHRSKDETEELIFEIFNNASFNYIGGLGAYWTSDFGPQYRYSDHVFVNPAYFQTRDIPVPAAVKSASPPAAGVVSGSRERTVGTWDAGYSHDEEADKVTAYMAKSRQQAAAGMEAPAVAHRLRPKAGPGVVVCSHCQPPIG